MNADTKASLQTTYEVIPTPDSKRFLKMRLRVCHTGVNRNGNMFSVDSFEKARGSLVNIPILAHVVIDEDGQKDFGAHDMHLEPTDNGAVPVYDEQAIGMIPETCNYAVEEYDGRHYVCVDAYIWREYSNYAEKIIEDNDFTPLSMEIDVLDSTVDKTYGVLHITNFCYRGVTLMGQDKLPAMVGAEAVKQNFEAQKKEFFEKMIQALNAELAEESETQKEGNEMQNEKQIPEEGGAINSDTPEAKTFENKETAPDEEPKTAEEPKEDSKKKFALMSTISKSLCAALDEFTYEIEEGFSFPKYTLWDLDFEKQIVYAMSWVDGEVYAASYVLEGDTATLVPNFKKQVATFRDFVDGQDTTFERKTDSLMTEQYIALQKNFDAVQKENEELKKFQADTMAAQKQAGIEAIFATFTDLEGHEEFAALKERAAEFELDALEKECYALRGKLGTAKFAYNKQDNGTARFNLPFSTGASSPSSGSELDELIKKYKKN